MFSGIIDRLNNIFEKLPSIFGSDEEEYREKLVLHLVLHTAALALEKNQYVEFAPLYGTCGTIKLSGNSLPVFKYTLFEKKIMEFIEVTVQVSKPDRIHFSSCIVASNEEKAKEVKEVEMQERYKIPFHRLAAYLYNYFPITRDSGVKTYGTIQPVKAEEIQILS